MKTENNVDREVFFIEHYCLADGKHIILKDYQVDFIKWLKTIKNKYKHFFITK